MQDVIEAIRNTYFPGKNTEEENKKLCDKYPFLAWYGDPLYKGYSEEKGPNYKFTWEDEVPEGWRKAFCPQMWDELKAILEKADYVDKFRFTQIKEKYGQLDIYYGCHPESISDELTEWEIKYLRLSRQFCIHCGKPTKYMTLGWITFVCEDCAKDYCIEIKDLDEYYKTPLAERQKFYKDFGKHD